ncbi:MAG TPA: hypothetical protein VD884_11450 [Ohtaekwangia sp.]|nr:hypothetical protein [Ohtaekwangia sp.]
MKATDFFNNLYDLFAKVLPGFILIVGIYAFFPQVKEFIPTLSLDLAGITLFVAAYVTGHVISPISALLDSVADYFADKINALRSNNLFDERKAAKAKARALFTVEGDKVIRRRLFEAMVRKQNLNVTVEIDTFLATGKFFRSLFVVLVMFATFPALTSCSNCIMEKLKLPIYYAMLGMLSAASFSIFVYYRSRFQDSVYRHFLCLFYKAKEE